MDLNPTTKKTQTVEKECEELARFLYHLYKTNKELVNHVLEEKPKNCTETKSKLD